MHNLQNELITVQGTQIRVKEFYGNDYISITDIASAKSDDSRAADIVKNWIRSRSTLEFLGTWEQLYNKNHFKVVEFDHFKAGAGLHTFTLSPSQWITRTGAIGIKTERGRYGGTYAHSDIAFEFASAISPVFRLFLIKEFQRLKTMEKCKTFAKMVSHGLTPPALVSRMAS